MQTWDCGMNNFLLAAGALVSLVFLVFRFGMSLFVNKTIEQTSKEDKSLAQQQLENQQKLSKVNKDLESLYEEREKMRQEYLDKAKSDQEKADEWNKS